MATIGQLVTADELLMMPEGEPCELVAGRIVMRGYTRMREAIVTGKIAYCLGQHVRTDKAGTLTIRAGFWTFRNPDTVLAPDVAFVRPERLPEPCKGYFPGAPDLAVEIASPSQRETEVNDKARAWLDAGTALVWVVWPDTRSVTVHRSGQKPAIFREQDTITGEDVLPGFECRVAEFFGG
jgi:Uma2 family endonuclease